jgi:hypothetical protein
MGSRFLLIISSLTLLSGCVVAPRFDLTEKIQFNYAPNVQAQQALSFSDLMCCLDCTA